MHTYKEVEKKIKKVRIFRELLLAFGRNKIIFKEKDDTKHFTLKFLKEGILDIHETIEGKEKKYPRTEKFDLKKLSEILKETLREELPGILQEIDISDPKYKRVKAFIFPQREDFKRATQRKKREIRIGKNELVQLMKDNFVPMKDLQNYDFKTACLLKEGEISALLYRIHGKYFHIKLDDMEALIKKIIEESKTCSIS